MYGQFLSVHDLISEKPMKNILEICFKYRKDIRSPNTSWVSLLKVKLWIFFKQINKILRRLEKLFVLKEIPSFPSTLKPKMCRGDLYSFNSIKNTYS